MVIYYMNSPIFVLMKSRTSSLLHSIFALFLLYILPHLVYSQESKTKKIDFQSTTKSSAIVEDLLTTEERIIKNALQDSDLYTVLAHTNSEVAPFIHGIHIIIPYYGDSKDTVFIAFEHENYTKTHAFASIEENPSLQVYIIPRTDIIQEIHYRLIINGIWTIDSQNPRFFIDNYGIQVSSVLVPKLPLLFYEPIVLKDDTIRFYLYIDSHKVPLKDTNLNTISGIDIVENPIFLTGSFTNWDPFLIRMNMLDDNKNLWYADVPIQQEGIHHYYYHATTTDFLDPKNLSISKRTINNDYVNSFSISSVY